MWQYLVYELPHRDLDGVWINIWKSVVGVKVNTSMNIPAVWVNIWTGIPGLWVNISIGPNVI